MGEVTVRRAVEADEPALLAIESTVWDASSGFPSMTPTDKSGFFNERSGPDAHLVAEDDGEVLGYLRLQEKYTFPEGNGVLSINGVAVAKEAQGRGIGSILLTAATEEDAPQRPQNHLERSRYEHRRKAALRAPRLHPRRNPPT